MKIAIACDHGGLNLKKEIINYLNAHGYTPVDFGTNKTDSCDYPDFALPAAEAVANGDCDKGIVVCSTGIGVSIVANKVPGYVARTATIPIARNLLACTTIQTCLHSAKRW